MEENRELTRAEIVEQDAKECFKQGLNCSECVMTAFLNHFDTGLPKEVVKLATGFGGGMGHTKNTCGAITGAVMALSAIVGRENPAAKETVGERITELQQGIYPIVGKMVNEIKDEYGTLICSELLKRIRKRFMQPRLCVEYVESLWTSHSSIHIRCRHV